MTAEVVRGYIPDTVRMISYPKVLQLGDPRITDLLKRPHIIEEKVDGAQFRFGKVNGKVLTGSHRVRFNEASPPDKMFQGAVDYVETLADVLTDGTIYFAEMVAKPKQNTILYGRTAKNGLMIFDAWDLGGNKWCSLDWLFAQAEIMGVDPPNIIARNDGTQPETLDTMERYLSTTSYLASENGTAVVIEGIVVKCYDEVLPVTYQQLPGLFGKFVRSSFKEENAVNWRGKKGSPVDAAVSRFKTEARWEKAVLHAVEEGKIQFAMQDMRVLLDELYRDIEEEVKPMAMEMFWEQAEHQVQKGLAGGMAEWWKKKLLVREVEGSK